MNHSFPIVSSPWDTLVLMLLKHRQVQDKADISLHRHRHHRQWCTFFKLVPFLAYFAIFGCFVANLRHFLVPLLQTWIVRWCPKNWQIPGMVQSITSILTREYKCRILRIVGGGVLWVLSIQYFGPQAPPLLVHHSPSYVPRVNFAVRSGVWIASVVNITWPVRTCPSIFTTRPICTSAHPKSIQFAQCFVWAPYYKYTL